MRADHARGTDEPPESGVPDQGRRRPSRVLPGVRRRPRRPDQARPRRGTDVRRDPPGRADAAVRARGPSDQRGAPLARARPHLQHGRVRERGRCDRACVVAGLVPARDARALLRAPRRRAAARRTTRSTSRRRTRSATTASGSRRSAAPTSATEASAGAGTSPSGRRTSARSSTATSTPTCGPARDSSSFTR